MQDTLYLRMGFISKEQHHHNMKKHCQDFLMLSIPNRQTPPPLHAVIFFFTNNFQSLGFVNRQEMNIFLLLLANCYDEFVRPRQGTREQSQTMKTREQSQAMATRNIPLRSFYESPFRPSLNQETTRNPVASSPDGAFDVAFSTVKGTIQKDSMLYRRGYLTKEQYNETLHKSCREFLLLACHECDHAQPLISIVNFFCTHIQMMGVLDTQDMNGLVLELSQTYHQVTQSTTASREGRSHVTELNPPIPPVTFPYNPTNPTNPVSRPPQLPLPFFPFNVPPPPLPLIPNSPLQHVQEQVDLGVPPPTFYTW